MPRPDHVPPGSGAARSCFWTPVTKNVQNDQGDRGRRPVLRPPALHGVLRRSSRRQNLDHLRAGQPDTGEPLTVDYQPAEDAIAATGGRASDTAAARRSIAQPATTSRFRPRRPLRASTNSMRPCFHELTPLERARVPAELEPQGEGEHVRPWRTRRRDRLVLLVQGTGRACLGEPRTTTSLTSEPGSRR